MCSDFHFTLTLYIVTYLLLCTYVVPRRNTMMPELVGTSGNEHTVYELSFKVVAPVSKEKIEFGFMICRCLGVWYIMWPSQIFLKTLFSNFYPGISILKLRSSIRGSKDPWKNFNSLRRKKEKWRKSIFQPTVDSGKNRFQKWQFDTLLVLIPRHQTSAYHKAKFNLFCRDGSYNFKTEFINCMFISGSANKFRHHGIVQTHIRQTKKYRNSK